MTTIEGKVAVVTGAGRGMGRAIAIELGRMGAKVALAARSRSELEETARTMGSNASVIPTDVRNRDEVFTVARLPVFKSLRDTHLTPHVLHDGFARLLPISHRDLKESHESRRKHEIPGTNSCLSIV